MRRSISFFFGFSLLLLFQAGLTSAFGGAPRSDPASSLAPGIRREKLENIWSRAVSCGSTALVVLHQGKPILDRGGASKKTSSHSVRKSLINGLIGIAREKGLIDLDSTLADLGIDDLQPLGPMEKGATVRNLLKSKSGVYLAAAAESGSMKTNRPPRHSHPPGTHFYYNNWGFQRLGHHLHQVHGKINRASL